MATANGHKCNDFDPPSSLKELLELFARIDRPNGEASGDVKNPVIQELKNRLTGDKDKNGWIKTGAEGANIFYASAANAISACQNMRTKILSDAQNNFGKYTFPFNKDCKAKYADAILSNAFPLFGCLFYLWFMCDNDNEAKGIRPNGGKKNGNSDWHWENEKVDGNGDGSSHGNPDHLKDFLTDQSGTENKFLTLPRGYGKNGTQLSDNKGNTLFQSGGTENLFSLHCPNAGNNSGRFQQALFFLLFLAPRWHPAMSGHALLFLDWFKDNASKEPFQDVQWLHATKAGQEYFNCNGQNGNDLKSKIEALAEGSNGANIAPVHKDSVNGSNGNNLYSNNGKSILHDNTSLTDNDKKAHVFMQYVSWLWWCIPELTESLKEMSADSAQWQKDKFQNSTSFGPFVFGFTFTNSHWTNGSGVNALPQNLQSLITAIEKFKCCIERFFWPILQLFSKFSFQVCAIYTSAWSAITTN